MLQSRPSDRSFDRSLETPSRGLSETIPVAKTRATAAARRRAALGKASRVTMAGLLEALSGLESVSNEPKSSSSVAVDSLTGNWMELPKGVTSNGFLQGMENALEVLQRHGGGTGNPSLHIECTKILQEEIELARYVDVFRKASQKA